MKRSIILVIPTTGDEAESRIADIDVNTTAADLLFAAGLDPRHWQLQIEKDGEFFSLSEEDTIYDWANNSAAADTTDFIRVGPAERMVYATPTDMVVGGVSVRSFEDIVLTNEVFQKPGQIFALLLYTDEDKEIVRYVRQHILEIHAMSGECVLYVLEKFSKSAERAIFDYWKRTLGEEFDELRDNYVQIKSRPLERTTAYELARQFGILPRQLPCIVFYESLDNKEGIVFQLTKVLPSARNEWPAALTPTFRQLFSAVEQSSKASESKRMKTLERNLNKTFQQDKQTMSDVISWAKVATETLPVKDIIEIILGQLNP